MASSTAAGTDALTPNAEALSGTHARCDLDDLREFAARWNLRRMWIYGSATGDDFGENSDIDLICDFGDDSLWFHENSLGSTINYRGRCRMELSDVFGRVADVLCVEQLNEDRNHIKRQDIWDQAVLVHEL